MRAQSLAPVTGVSIWRVFEVKLAIAGAGAPAGKELLELLTQQGVAYITVPESLLLAGNPSELDRLLERQRPDQLINLNAFEAGSQAALELAEASKKECAELQRDYAARLAGACGRHELPMLHLSTCYVFDGEKRLGYNEQDDTNPQGVYGRNALKGEQAIEKLKQHVILRTGWQFGRSQHDIIRVWIERCKSQQGSLEVLQRRFSPTPSEDIARVILAVCRQVDCDASVWGTYHYCGLETKKEIEFVQQVLKYASQHDEQIYQYLDNFTFTEIAPVKPQVANTTLSSKKIFDTFGIKQRSWHGALQATIKALYHDGTEMKADSPPGRAVNLSDAMSSRRLH